MAGKFIELNDAAQMLGMSPEELKELRDAGDIHGYRDGASWKFKPEEVERVANERGAALSPADDADGFEDGDLDSLISLDSESDVSLDSGEELDASSILISDEAVGEGSGGSTVIGKDGEKGDADGSDLKIESESEISLADSGSQIEAVDEASDLKLESDSEGSDLQLADDENLSGEFELSSDEFSLGSDELKLEAVEEEPDLALSDDDDLLLGGSDSALGASDSGIGLGSPSDSGLSLEAEDLADGESSLELPEDEDMMSLSGVDMVDAEDATQLKQDEEFMLTPSDELMGDESSDSGSQVIALEDSEALEEDAIDMVEADDASLLDDVEAGAALQPEMQTYEEAGVAPAGAVMMAPEVPYSIWNVLGLLIIFVFLGLTGVLMTDVVRNMWSWDGSYSATSSLMDALITALGMGR